jgi:homogentisate 1,2-dioxygenase
VKHWISLPRVEGISSRQAHADLPEGTYERELGREGFFGPATQMYHRHPPTGWTDWDGPLRPRAFDLTRLEACASDPWQATEVLHNACVRYRFWNTQGKMDALARNADGDDLLFVHRGRGELFCDYGHLSIREGDYLVLPRGTMWRTEFDGTAQVLMIEATGDSYRLPDRGPAGPHAIFDPAVLDTPAMDAAFRAQQSAEGAEAPWGVRIKRRNQVSTVTYPFNPLDAVPRPFESDPGALKVPFFHSNDDYDEVLFYHRGDFFSRDNIEAGMVTLHPSGFPHGPHPKALENALEPRKAGTDEVAVMLDTRDALEVGALPEAVENPDYVNSWRPAARAEAAE